MTRILVFGTFDMLHPGHEHLFREARALGEEPFLIVSVARDANALRIKGRMPEKDENLRVAHVTAHPLVDEAVLGGVDDHIAHISELAPDIIALGYDQEGVYVERLQEKLLAAGVAARIARISSLEPGTYKTSLLRDTMPE